MHADKRGYVVYTERKEKKTNWPQINDDERGWFFFSKALSCFIK